MRRVLAKDNETLDLICYRHYGREDVVTDVLMANPHIARLSAFLPAGTIVDLPDVKLPREEDVIRIWS
jgi:phage tail protein X